MTQTTLPYPRHIGIQYAKKHILTESLFIEQWQIPKGTVTILVTTRNFGICKIPENTKDERGFIIPRTIFAY